MIIIWSYSMICFMALSWIPLKKSLWFRSWSKKMMLLCFRKVHAPAYLKSNKHLEKLVTIMIRLWYTILTIKQILVIKAKPNFYKPWKNSHNPLLCLIWLSKVNLWEAANQFLLWLIMVSWLSLWIVWRINWFWKPKSEENMIFGSRFIKFRIKIIKKIVCNQKYHHLNMFSI